jgi:hypothetical protein
MHSVLNICEIVDRNSRTVFAKAIGEHAIGCISSAEVRDRGANGLDTPERLNRNGIRATVSNRDGEGYEVRIAMQFQGIDQIRLAVESGIGNR